MVQKKLLQVILEKLKVYFSSLEMIKQKEDIYLKNITENVIGLVGLNRAVKNKGNYVEINAVIGIRHQEIEKLVAILEEVKYHNYLPPTLSIPIGYITPNKCYSPMIFTPDSNIDKVIEDFRIQFEKYGNAFFKQNTTLAEISKTLNDKVFLRPQQSEYRIAVCYFLLKEYDKAKEYINQQLEKLKGRQGGLVDYMNTFAKKSFALIEKEQSNPKPSP